MNDIRTDWIILLVAAIFGFIIKTRPTYTYLKSVPFFLLLTLFVELIGRYYRLRSINNVWLFNMYTVIEFTYFTYLLYCILKRTFIRRFIFFIPILCLINILFIQGINTFHTYTYAISVFIIVFLCIYYYYVTFKEGFIENLLRESSFWLVTGLLIFFTTSLSVLGVMNFIAELPKQTINLTRNILLTVNGIFYFILIIAFVCQINTRKSILNS